jgi:hypothetical protein
VQGPEFRNACYAGRVTSPKQGAPTRELVISPATCWLYESCNPASHVVLHREANRGTDKNKSPRAARAPGVIWMVAGEGVAQSVAVGQIILRLGVVQRVATLGFIVAASSAVFCTAPTVRDSGQTNRRLSKTSSTTLKSFPFVLIYDSVLGTAMETITFHYEFSSVHPISFHTNIARFTACSAIHYVNWPAMHLYEVCEPIVFFDQSIHLRLCKRHLHLLGLWNCQNRARLQRRRDRVTNQVRII